MEGAELIQRVKHLFQPQFQQIATQITALRDDFAAYRLETNKTIFNQKRKIANLQSIVQDLASEVAKLKHDDMASSQTSSNNSVGWAFSSSLSSQKRSQISSLLAMNGLLDGSSESSLSDSSTVNEKVSSMESSNGSILVSSAALDNQKIGPVESGNMSSNTTGWVFSSSLTAEKRSQISSLIGVNGLSHGSNNGLVSESPSALRKKKADAAFARMVASYPSAKVMSRSSHDAGNVFVPESPAALRKKKADVAFARMVASYPGAKVFGRTVHSPAKDTKRPHAAPIDSGICNSEVMGNMVCLKSSSTASSEPAVQQQKKISLEISGINTMSPASHEVSAKVVRTTALAEDTYIKCKLKAEVTDQHSPLTTKKVIGPCAGTLATAHPPPKGHTEISMDTSASRHPGATSTKAAPLSLAKDSVCSRSKAPSPEANHSVEPVASRHGELSQALCRHRALKRAQEELTVRSQGYLAHATGYSLEAAWFGGQSAVPRLDLLYQATRDGWSAKDFHSLCDNVGPTLTVVHTPAGAVFGGYTDQSWDSVSGFKKSQASWLFTLHKPNGPLQIRTQPDEEGGAILCHADCLPVFGNDLFLVSHANTPVAPGAKAQSYSDLGHTYEVPPGCGDQGSNVTRSILTGSYRFTPDEVCVYAATHVCQAHTKNPVHKHKRAE